MTKHLGRSGPQDEATAGPVNASALDVSGIHMHPMLQWLKLGRHLEPSIFENLQKQHGTGSTTNKRFFSSTSTMY